MFSVLADLLGALIKDSSRRLELILCPFGGGGTPHQCDRSLSQSVERSPEAPRPMTQPLDLRPENRVLKLRPAMKIF
jgi:hypothetical protein